MADKIKYVKHPVSAEEKEKLRKEGYKILDKRFDPKKDASKQEEKEVPKQEQKEQPKKGKK